MIAYEPEPAPSPCEYCGSDSPESPICEGCRIVAIEDVEVKMTLVHYRVRSAITNAYKCMSEFVAKDERHNDAEAIRLARAETILFLVIDKVSKQIQKYQRENL